MSPRTNSSRLSNVRVIATNSAPFAIEHETVSPQSSTSQKQRRSQPDIPITVLQQTEHWIAVDKPPGVLMHRSRLYYSTPGERFLVDAVHRKLSAEQSRQVEVRPVQRLDRPTSGVVIFGLNDKRNAAMIQEALQASTARKQYWTLAFGAKEMPHTWQNSSPLKDLVGRNRKQRAASTDFERLGVFSEADIAVVRATLATGRRHQIRRHLSFGRFPVVGDTSHGDSGLNHIAKSAFGVTRLCLHSRRVSFVDPFTSKVIELQVPVPDDLRQVLTALPGYSTEMDAQLDLHDDGLGERLHTSADSSDSTSDEGCENYQEESNAF